MNERPPSIYRDTYNIGSGIVCRERAYRMPNGSIEYHRATKKRRIAQHGLSLALYRTMAKELK